MKKLKFLVILRAIAVILGSCSKGDTGPAGQDGATGPQGNANVSGGTVTITSSSQWTWSGVLYYVDINVPALTQDILNTGAVEVFVNTNGNGTTWAALPYTDILGSTNLVWNYVTTLNQVEVHFAWNDGAQDGDPNTHYNSSSIGFKTVCISSYAMKEHPNTNWKDYNQVNAILQVENKLNSK